MSGGTDIDERIEALIEEVKRGLMPEMDDEVQLLLGRILGYLQYLNNDGYAHFIGPIEISVKGLLQDEPNIRLAAEVLENLKRKVKSEKVPFESILDRGAPPTRVILGLGVLLYIVIPAFALISRIVFSNVSILGLDMQLLVVVGISGAIGSIVSIIVRIQDFSEMDDVDSSILFFTGFFKPIIGASIACFVLALIRAGLIPIEVSGIDTYFFVALAFVAGFSERFARDVVSITVASPSESESTA